MMGGLPSCLAISVRMASACAVNNSPWNDASRQALGNTDVKPRRAALRELVQRLQVAPDERRFKLREVCELLQPAVPYCDEKVHGRQRGGDDKKLSKHLMVQTAARLQRRGAKGEWGTSGNLERASKTPEIELGCPGRKRGTNKVAALQPHQSLIVNLGS